MLTMCFVLYVFTWKFNRQFFQVEFVAQGPVLGSHKPKKRLQDFILPEDPTKVFAKLQKIDEGSTGNVYKTTHLKTNMKVKKIYFTISVL